jgi:acetyl-CoA C-acetyltransferase
MAVSSARSSPVRPRSVRKASNPDPANPDPSNPDPSNPTPRTPTPRAAGLTLADIDPIELNEAFAVQVLACTREWNVGELGSADFERLNVKGSGIALGHPVGATGARIHATLTREVARRDARYGLETMCIGGGQGLAAVFERA